MREQVEGEDRQQDEAGPGVQRHDRPRAELEWLAEGDPGEPAADRRDRDRGEGQPARKADDRAATDGGGQRPAELDGDGDRETPADDPMGGEDPGAAG